MFSKKLSWIPLDKEDIDNKDIIRHSLQVFNQTLERRKKCLSKKTYRKVQKLMYKIFDLLADK